MREFSAKADTGDENGLINPLNSPIYRELLSFPDADPLYVSPSNQEPSDNIAHCLGYIFPKVAERAKQNNILLTKKEIYLLDYYISEFDSYCPDYDVTIVVDGGGSMKKEIQRMVVEIGLKEHNVRRVGECCVIITTNLNHEYAAAQLYSDIRDSDKLRYWKPLAAALGKTTIEINTEQVYDFFDQFPQWSPSQDQNKIKKIVEINKNPDSSSAPLYCERICDAFSMTPFSTLAIECTNSDDFRKLFHDCIIWVAGALLQVHAVIGVNISPNTYSVDILNFDLTVERMMELVRTLQGEQYVHTRGALCQVIKMKSSVQVLHLKLLEYLLSNPELHKETATQQDIEKINRYLQEELAQAQELCPDLKIRPLELPQFPRINIDKIQPFHNDIKTELAYHRRVLGELHDYKVQLRPQQAVVRCAYILVVHTMPMIFGPISEQFLLPQGAKVKVPIRALAGIGSGYVEYPPNELRDYLRELAPKQLIGQQTHKLNPIPLEWINDPTSLAAERGISVEEMSPENYDSKETLGGEIKFCYLTDKALQHILNTEIGFNIDGNTNREVVIWLLIRNHERNAIQKPLLEDVEPRNPIQRLLGLPDWWFGYGRLSDKLLPSSYDRKSLIHPASRGIHTSACTLVPRRGIHTTALPLPPRRGIHTTALPLLPRRVCGTLWTTVSRLSRH